VSYVQGTGVRLQADFADPVTRAPVVPPDIVLTVKPPTGVVFQRTLSGGDILPDARRAGRFYYVLDTSPEPGTWQYQFEAIGAVTDQVVERKAITVSRKLA
jgi:hypothetical protein